MISINNRMATIFNKFFKSWKMLSNLTTFHPRYQLFPLLETQIDKNALISSWICWYLGWNSTVFPEKVPKVTSEYQKMAAI